MRAFVRPSVAAALVLWAACASPASVSSGWSFATLTSTTLSVPASTPTSHGSSISVPILASPADGFLGVDLTINFDAAVIQATGASASGIATSFGSSANLTTPGRVVLSMYATQNALQGSGEIARVQFLVSGAPGTSSALTFTSAVVNEGAIVPVLQGGAVIVNCTGATNGTPCNDGNPCTAGETCQSSSCTGGTAITGPGEVANLRIGPVKSALSWTPATGGAGTVHDILRGVVSGLPVGGPSDVCFQSSVAAASTTDSNDPSSSIAFWYLVRGRNSCGTGSYGFAEVHGVPGAERLSSVCP